MKTSRDAWRAGLFLLGFMSTAPGLPAAATPPVAPLPVAIVWHQHQPRYAVKDGVIQEPWVRLHAAKDYLDMAAIAREFPGLKLTVNLTPVLLDQVEAYGRGTRDAVELLAERCARGPLSPSDLALAGERFLQVSAPMRARWPRLAELAARSAASWSRAEQLDAATCFHLAWTDPDALARAPLARLARRGRGYSAADLRLVLAEQRRMLAQIIPLHRVLEQEGRLEVSSTPAYHPILPLLADTDLAREALPASAMPATRLREPGDARWHVQEAVRSHVRRFGRAPRGMWPGEGSVAQAVAPLFREAGVRWIATDEEVLARSLGKTFRDGETLRGEAYGPLYRAYQVKDGPLVCFRDRKLSDDIGFRYARMSGAAAAADLLGQLRAIAARTHDPDRLVTIVLDGENAWENYPDDGKAFLRALYHGLTHDPSLVTTTPSAFLAHHRATPLPRLWAGSWIGASFATWIGEAEENRAWDLLTEARAAVSAHARRHGTDHPAQRAAMRALRAAEGSDWFWWYGADQDSGRDEVFDRAYRDLLAESYRAIGLTVPASVGVAIVQPRPAAALMPASQVHPRLDGRLEASEWRGAAVYRAAGGAMASGGRQLDAFLAGVDGQGLHVGLGHPPADRPVSLRVDRPVPEGKRRRTWQIGPGGQVSGPGAGSRSSTDAARAVRGDEALELTVPWSALDPVDGEILEVSVVTDRLQVPPEPVRIRVPVLPRPSRLRLVDATPDVAVQPPTAEGYDGDVLDLRALEVGADGDDWVFTWTLGAVKDPWHAPDGLSLVTLEAYIGFREMGAPGTAWPLLAARRARVEVPWSVALVVEGWECGLFRPDGTRLAELRVTVDREAGLVRARLPRTMIPGEPEGWHVLGTLLAQDGFSAGRIRPVRARADRDHPGPGPFGDGCPVLDAVSTPGWQLRAGDDRPR
jgi:alpha-amylase/alpha-mannosidase (GH57 family)